LEVFGVPAPGRVGIQASYTLQGLTFALQGNSIILPPPAQLP
jgi:hypothetical protein